MECPCRRTNDSCSHLLVTSRRKKNSRELRLATSGNQSQHRECHSIFKPDITGSLAIGMVQSQLRTSTGRLLQRSEQLFVMLADFIRRWRCGERWCVVWLTTVHFVPPLSQQILFS